MPSWTGWSVWAVAAGLAAVGVGAAPAESAAPGVPTADAYVATDGNDAWSGRLPAPNADRTDGPFATLERARDEGRRRRAAAAADPAAGYTVLVRGGLYSLARTFRLEAQDSGTAAAPVVYRAWPGETVQLCGGPSLAPEAFQPVTDAAVLTRLDPAVRGQILQTDLHALGITDLPELPAKFNGAPPLPELFVNHQRLTLARWPNEGWATIAAIVDTGSTPRTGDAGARGGVFEYSGDRPARWNTAAGVWLHGYWCFDWYAELIRVQAIDAQARRITLAAPSVYGVKQGNPSPRRWYALNLLEELDRPGEYYIDRQTGRLYVLPPAPLAGAQILLSRLAGPLLALENVHDLTIRGFVAEATLGNGIEVRAGSGVRIQACEVRNTRDLGILVEGGTGHVVEACDIHDTGTGGLLLSGGDRKTLTPGGHQAVNNHIWQFSRHKLTYANAILLQGVGNRVAHCLIHDAPHQAIGVGGNDHVFEYNIVHHICTETDDCGAYYKGRDPSCRGNLVRYNFWHHIGSPMGHGNAAVYFDDGDGGDTVVGNVFFRCGDPGKGSFGTVFSHGGHDNRAENNVFIECKRALGSAPWNDKRWQEALDGGQDCGWLEKLRKDVDITQPPYTTRYPELVGFLDPPPGQPRANHAQRNLIVMGAETKSGNWQVDPAANWVTDQDPGFVDAAAGDFRLRPDAEVFTRLPGFEPIPFDKMGLYADELRPNPVREPWTYPPPKALPPLAAARAAAAALRARTAPAPVCQVRRAAGPIAVDGVIDPAEWGGADPAAALRLEQDVSGTPATRRSLAWLARDADALCLAVSSDIDPQTPLTGNQWGADDAVEVSLRPELQGRTPPITVVRGYGNGFVQFGTTPNGDEEPKAMDPGAIVFKAGRPEPGRWTAEFRIPFRMLDLDPAATPRLAFSLTVRKAHDDLWLMWVATRGHSYDVGQAGILELVP